MDKLQALQGAIQAALTEDWDHALAWSTRADKGPMRALINFDEGGHPFLWVAHEKRALTCNEEGVQRWSAVSLWWESIGAFNDLDVHAAAQWLLGAA